MRMALAIILLPISKHTSTKLKRLVKSSFFRSGVRVTLILKTTTARLEHLSPQPHATTISRYSFPAWQRHNGILRKLIDVGFANYRGGCSLALLAGASQS